MKIDRHFARKVLWAPTAAFTVSITLYLAHLVLSQNEIKPLNALLEEKPEVISEEVIPKAQEGNGEENQQEQSQEQEEQKENKEEQKAEEETSQPKESEEATPVIPPPPPTAASTTVSDQDEGEGESSSNKEESQSTPPSAGNTDLEKYIEAKIKDLNAHGKEWNEKYPNELLASWKLSSTTQSLLSAIKEFMKNNGGDSSSNQEA